MTLVELMTYRRKGHAEHDNQSYVPAGEIDRWARENDPVDRYVQRLTTTEGVAAAELEAIEARVQAEIDDATDVAEKSPPPEPRDCLVGIYADPPRGAGSGTAKACESAVDRARAAGELGDARWLRSPTSRPSAQGLFEEMERDPNVFCMGEDIGAYGGAFKVTEGLMERFGDRAGDRHADQRDRRFVGAAAGAAHMGMRPVCEMQFIDFLSSAYSILTNYVATARYRAFLPCPMVVRGPSGGYVRGGPFHSQNPEAAFLHTPGLKIVYPATASDAKGLIKSADPRRRLRALLRAQVSLSPDQGRAAAGRPRRPDRQGAARPRRDGPHHHHLRGDGVEGAGSGRAARAEDGLSVEVLDLRSLLPMDDEAILATVKKTNRVLIVHEDTVTGGIAGEITARINELAFEWLDAPVRRVAAHDVPLPYAPQLEDFVLPQTPDIVRAARWLAAY